MKIRKTPKHVLAMFCLLTIVLSSLFATPIFAYTEDTATYTFEDNYAGWTSTTDNKQYAPAALSISTEQFFAGNSSLKASFTPIENTNDRIRIGMPIDQLVSGKIATYRFYLPVGSPVTSVNFNIDPKSSVTIRSLTKGGWNTVSFKLPPVTFYTTYHFVNFNSGTKNVPFDVYIDSVDFNFPDPVEPVVDPVYGSNIIRGKYFKGAVAKLGNISNITWFDMFHGNYLTNEKMTDGNTTQHYDYNYGDKADTDYPAAVYDLGDYYDVTKMTAFVGIKDYEITGMNFYASEDLDNLFSDVNKVFTITDDLSFEKTLDINENPKRARFVAFMMTTHNKTNFRAKEFEHKYQAPGMQEMIRVIRAVGAKNVLTVGGLDWSYELDGIVNGFAPDDCGGNGYMLDSHVYPCKTLDKWDDYVTVAKEKFPILIGECGHYGEAPVPHEWPQLETSDIWVPKFLNWVEKHGYHITAWDFHHRAGPPLVENLDDYTPTSFWGVYVKEFLA